MIGYRDMAFCASDCINAACCRHFGPADQAAARTWWGGDDVPVAYADFSEGCLNYRAQRETTDD